MTPSNSPEGGELALRKGNEKILGSTSRTKSSPKGRNQEGCNSFTHSSIFETAHSLMKKFYFLLFGVIISLRVFSQCAILPNASQGISYSYVQGGGTNASGVAYNPNLNIYYAVIAGNPGFPYETFDAAGTSLYQTNAGFDFRGLWWNPNFNQVEGNGFNNFGWWTSTLNGSGYALNTGANIFAGMLQPDAQSCGDYDCQADEIIYYFSGSIYRYSRASGAFVGSYALTGCPVPVANWNWTSVVYTGCAGNEIGIEDYVGKNILLFNKATGAYSGMSALPVTAVTNNGFRFSYANNLVWLYDVATRKWTSYRIFSGNPNGTAVVNLGNDTTVCNGQTVVLDAGNTGATYLWQNGATAQTFTVTGPGVYYVAVNPGGCFIAHDTIVVNYNNGNVTLNLGNDTTICNGQPLTLNATTNSATYLWSTGATTNTISVNTSGNYWAQVTVNGCSGADTISVGLGVPASTTVNAAICPNAAYTLPDGSSVSSAGTYVDTLLSSIGCDSIITTNLSVASLTIDAGNNVAICNGYSTQLNATGGLIYIWTPATGLSDPSIANPVASPTSTTTYTVSSQAAIGNLIVNGDFTSGNTGFSSGYAYTPPPNSNQGQYWVSTNAQVWNGGMAACGDHTTGSGNMLLVNGATTPNVSVYCETVNVQPNTDYAFTTWLQTLTAGNLAQLQFSINGNLLGAVFTAPAALCSWQQFYQVWNSGANTSATICVVNQNTNAGANDFALDDISFSPLCTSTDSVVVTVNPVYSNSVNASFCQNQNYTLPDGSTTSTAGTYVDTLPTVNGCDSIITTILSVNPIYSYTINQTICPSDIYILPDGTPMNVTGVYPVMLTTVNGCDSLITVNLNVVPPSITVSSDTQICLGNSVQLNASGGLFSYQWTPGATLSDSTIANPVASPTITTSYIVTTQVASGDLIGNGNFEGGNAAFSSSYIYTTDLFPEGTYYVGTNPNFYHSGFSACPDHTTGTGNMMIINGSGTPNTNVWCETINVVPNTNYAFGCWVTSVAGGSPAVLQFQINGTLLGSPFLAPFSTCIWQQFYSLWNSGANTTATICIVNQNTALGGNDFALDDISFIGLCNVSDTVTITVHQPTTTNISASICNGNTYTFPSGAASTVAVIDTSLLLDQFGCDSTIITDLMVNPTPVNNVFDTICANQNYTLPSGNSVNIAGIYTDTLATTLGCDSIVITNLTVNPTSTATVLDTICTGSSFILPDGNSVNTAGIYPVTMQNQFGCDSVITTNLTVISVSLNATSTALLCNGDGTGSISSSASGGVSPYNFTLNQNLNPIASNTNGNFLNLPAGNYSVDATDDFGCNASTNIIVSEPPLLQSSATAADVTCFGFGDGQIVVTAQGGTPNYIFALNAFSNSTGVFNSLIAGNYFFTVSDANGCVDSSSSAIVVNEPAEVLLSVNPSSAELDLGQTLLLNASSNYDPNASYVWNPPTGLSCSDCASPLFSGNSSMIYHLEVSVNINGNICTASTIVPVTIIPEYSLFIPNVFTPNGDGNNDFFEFFGKKSTLKFIDIKIFNRWGEKIFESNDINFKWDGTYRGKLLNPDVFVYTLTAVFLDNHAEKMFTGSLTLVK